MKNPILLLAAIALLAGCETMPKWAQDLNRPLHSGAAGTADTAAAAPAAAPTPTPAPPPANYTPPADQQLLDLERRLATTAQTDGLAAALAPVLDPKDGFVIRPGEIYSGPESVPAALGGAGQNGPLFWQADRVFVSSAGDMGVTSGRYVQVNGTQAVQGRYLVVWRKDEQGVWKALAETRVPDPAPSARRRR